VRRYENHINLVYPVSKALISEIQAVFMSMFLFETDNIHMKQPYWCHQEDKSFVSLHSSAISLATSRAGGLDANEYILVADKFNLIQFIITF
jgi:hypothetical protein